MSWDEPGHPGHPLVWAFFTERGGAKHQVHYVNDSAIAKGWQGEVYYRPMQYAISDLSNGARNLQISFVDKDGQEVQFSADFSRSTPLTIENAGLTNQIGHDADSFFLIFFREKHTTTTSLQFLIGGKDYSFRETEETQAFRFHAAYSRNIYVATINYNNFELIRAGDAIHISRGGTFRWDSANFAWIEDKNLFGSETRLTLNSRGALRAYECWDHGHVFRFAFTPVNVAQWNSPDMARVLRRALTTRYVDPY
jgi:hypothetical protein